VENTELLKAMDKNAGRNEGRNESPPKGNKGRHKNQPSQEEANHEEMMAKLDAQHEGMKACVNAWRKETTACQEETEAYPEKWMQVQKKWNPERSIRRSQRKIPQWKLAERRISSIGAGI
jgi:hypothetical protein